YDRGPGLFAAIQSQGALAIVAHPRGAPDAGVFEFADGMEMYDVADTMRDRLIEVPRYIVEFVLAHAQYQEELLLPLVERLNWHLLQWDRVTHTRRFVGLAGNDAHQNISFLG